jgi:hypothetical protein
MPPSEVRNRNSPSATLNTYPWQNEPTWSRSEKAAARKVFDAALKRELQEVMEQAKQMAKQIQEPADAWALERYWTQRRMDIDRKYEFRLSRLAQVLGALVCEVESVRKNCAACRKTR